MQSDFKRKDPARDALESPPDFIVALFAFPLSMVVASLIAAAFVAIMTGGGGGRSHLNWNNIWLSLVNSVLAGACIGLLCGLLCTFGYRIRHPRESLATSADRSLDAMQSPVYVIGLITGALIAFATCSTFWGALIWRWRIP